MRANVIIQKSGFGNAADVDENFQVKFFPTSNWKMKVSYVGYVPIFGDIIIIENETAGYISAGYRVKCNMDQATFIL